MKLPSFINDEFYYSLPLKKKVYELNTEKNKIKNINRKKIYIYGNKYLQELRLERRNIFFCR